MSRAWILLLAGALLACSGSDDDTTAGPSATAPSSSEPAPATDLDAADTIEKSAETASEASADATLASEVVPQWSVSIDMSADGFGQAPIDASVAWTGDPNDVVDDGPFGSYAACSGLRDDVGAYSVFVSGDDAIDAVGAWTATPVTGPGLYDAEVRVERPGAAPLTASGTMTILDGLQEGEFQAFGPDGGRIEGTFSCSGSEPPSPLVSADGDVARGEAEVFALLRDGDAERFVGLATDDVAACGSAGADVLRVDGDAAVGAITEIEVAAAPDESVRLRVAGTEYEFTDAAVVLDEAAGVSGAFSATTPDGISVDGAFRCT